MKLPKLLHVFILTALVTFSLISPITSPGSAGLPSGNDPSYAKASADRCALINPSQSSPSFMQQLSSCGQRLKNLARFAVMTSAVLSPEAAGRSLTEPSQNLPLLYSTPFPVDKFSGFRALHPTKPQVALGGIGLISIVDINAANNPTMINVGKVGKNGFVSTLAYNPQGTLLAYGAGYEIGIIEDSTNKVIQTIGQAAGAFVFNAEGTELIVQTAYNSSIWTWNLEDNTQTPINVTTNPEGIEYISRLLRENTFVSNNPNGTTKWNLEDPSGATNLPINSSYTTIFGGNQDEYFAYNSWISADTNLIQIISNNQSRFISVGDKSSIVGRARYSPKLKKYFFTITDFGVDYFELYAVDPQTGDLELILNLPQKNSSFILNYAEFNDAGSKLFAIADASNISIQFAYMDLIELMNNK